MKTPRLAFLSILLLAAFQFGCKESEPVAPVVIPPDPYDPNAGAAQWKVYTSGIDKIPSQNIGSIGFASDRVWLFQTESDAVYYLQTGVGKTVFLGAICNDGSAGEPKRIAVDSDNNVWYRECKTLMRWTSGTSTKVSDFAGLANAGVVDVLAKGKKVWVSTISGAAEYDGSSWKKLPTTGWMEKSYLAIGLDGTIWAASGDVLKKLNGNTWQTILNGSAGQDKYTAIAVGGNGYVWFAYAGSPLYFYDGKDGFQYDNLAPSFSGIACSGGDTVWASSTKGAFRLAAGVWTKFDKSSGLGSDVLTTVAIDPLGNKWFGASGTLTRYTGK